MADGWQNRRLETSYREDRSVIEAQRAVISDVDTKAVSTVRVLVVLVSIVVAAARIGGSEMFHPWLLVAGLGSLLLALGLGVPTYAESNRYLGPNRAYIRQLVTDDVDAETWEEDIPHRMADWIDENDRNVRWNGGLLTLTQLSLLVGVVFLVWDVALRPEKGKVEEWEMETKRREANGTPEISVDDPVRESNSCPGS